MSEPVFRERPAQAEAQGLLVLHHGRGTDEHDLLPLADALDPQRRLHVITPRAPLTLPGWSGHHWYVVPQVGYPDPETFAASYKLLADFHDELWRRTGLGPERTVLGGFSMGCVMSYALGLGADRPAPAGVLACSGFIPLVEGWAPHFSDRAKLRVLLRHGSEDPVIEVSFARSARAQIEAAGLELDYEEFPGGHFIPPQVLPVAQAWLASVIP